MARYCIFGSQFPGFELLTGQDGYLEHLRVHRAYASRDGAEDILDHYHRALLWEGWLSQRPLEPDVVKELTAFTSAAWPDHFDDQVLEDLAHPELYPHLGIRLEPPRWAPLLQMDELAHIVRFDEARVHAVPRWVPSLAPPNDGPGQFLSFYQIERIEPAPWPPPLPERAELARGYEEEEVAWDWVLSHSQGSVPRAEARRRARELHLSWDLPVHRALAAYTPSVEGLRPFLPEWVLVFPDRPWTLR